MTRPEIWIRVESLIRQLVDKYAPEKIILFGSAAREDGEANDIDLFIVKDDVPHLGAERLSLGDPFVVGIFKEGKVLYG